MYPPKNDYANANDQFIFLIDTTIQGLPVTTVDSIDDSFCRTLLILYILWNNYL